MSGPYNFFEFIFGFRCNRHHVIKILQRDPGFIDWFVIFHLFHQEGLFGIYRLDSSMPNLKYTFQWPV